MTAASLSIRDRATCLNHYLPPSERSLPCRPSHRPRVTQMLRLWCAPSGLWGFTLTVRTAFGNLTSFSFAMVVERRAMSKQRLSHWIVDTIKAAYTSQGLECPLHIRAHSTRAIIKSSRGMYSGYMLRSRLVFSEYLRQVLQAGRSVLSLPSAVGEWLIHILLPLFAGVAARTVITLRSPL